MFDLAQGGPIVLPIFVFAALRAHVPAPRCTFVNGLTRRIGTLCWCPYEKCPSCRLFLDYTSSICGTALLLGGEDYQPQPKTIEVLCILDAIFIDHNRHNNTCVECFRSSESQLTAA